MASHFQPYLMDSIEGDSIISVIQYLNGINPEIDIYLLSSNGMIKWFYPSQNPDAEVQISRVNTAPLDEFIAGEMLPIYGDDPLNAGVKKPFSVAPISIMGSKGCYLYVILSGQQFDQAAAMVQNSYILRNTFIGLGLILLVTLILGLIVFRLLTSRLRHVSETVKSFEQGQLERRVKVNSNDEVGLLGASFNQMADTLVSNMDEIKQIDKLRRELVANVSHDLRSPLASIQGYLETIQQKEPSINPEDRSKYYEIVLRNTKKLGTLIEELFELSKFDAQDVQPEMEPVSMAELAQDLVQQFKPLAEQKGITLKAVLSDEHTNLVYADIALMERAISNLIDNALKHTPAGGTVSIISTNDKENVSFTISDTGKGIAEENIQRIFDRFYQEDPSRTVGSGAGLGLSIAQKILELHGSKLSVESKSGNGTTFSFVLSPQISY
ncbi:MAG: two-component sensor histidine kinase [Bacteroidetes bacterium]|nr:two-component sensor histidine kinase [Bacteroidota bacterium]